MTITWKSEWSWGLQVLILALIFLDLQQKKKQVELEEERGGKTLIYCKKQTFYTAIEFKEKFIVKKGLTFEISGKIKQSWYVDWKVNSSIEYS